MVLKSTKPAAVWKRILAFVLDLYLSVAITGGLIMLVMPKKGIDVATAMAHPELVATPTLVSAFFYMMMFVVLYHVFCEYIVGQTPGMLVFGLTIKNNNKDRDELSFGQALLRNIFLIPLFPFYLFWLIEPLFYVFQGERLLEYWTHTETVE